MNWKSSHNSPPNVGQEVYYFGPNIGIGIGKYTYEERTIKHMGKEVQLCPHIFTNNSFGVVDACDAPYWMPYDEHRARSWCPIVPKEYTKGLYEND